MNQYEANSKLTCSFSRACVGGADDEDCDATGVVVAGAVAVVVAAAVAVVVAVAVVGAAVGATEEESCGGAGLEEGWGDDLNRV